MNATRNQVAAALPMMSYQLVILMGDGGVDS